MGDRSAIEWTEATWNPVTGCDEVTPGCDNCYAKTFAERWRGTPGHYFEQGFDVVLRPTKLQLPLTWRRHRRVFVNSMSDLFHANIPDDFIARVFAVMAATPRHTYQLLTKRHGRMRSLLSRDQFRADVAIRLGGLAVRHDEVPAPMPWPLPNLWLGVSVEDQERAELRIPALLDTPAAVRWLSCEPLLGEVDIFANSNIDRDPGLNWVVVGGESGLRSRPMEVRWARGLRDECVGAGIPFFFKQWGGRTPKANGRELDDRTWDEMPGPQVAELSAG